MSSPFAPLRRGAQRESQTLPVPHAVDEASKTIALRSRSPLKFFALTVALSSPFWLIGAVTRRELLPGVPVSSLMAVCPMISASILVYQESKAAGVRELLKRVFDFKRIKPKIWYAPIILLPPGMMVLSYGLMRLLSLPLPPPEFPVLAVPALFIALFVEAAAEELGWTGYATDPLQDRWDALQASVILGTVWAIWHIVPLVQVNRSAEWIAWWCLFTVAARVLIVWLYNNTGKSVFAAILYHAISNLSWQLFPNNGSHFDPRVSAPIITVVAALVTALWGPQTLARFRYARPDKPHPSAS